jgi:hypothetical protein
LVIGGHCCRADSSVHSLAMLVDKTERDTTATNRHLEKMRVSAIRAKLQAAGVKCDAFSDTSLVGVMGVIAQK